MNTDILLDPQLKWWMLLPISIAMVLVGILRSNVTFLLSSKAKGVSYKNARQRYVKKLSNFGPVSQERKFKMRGREKEDLKHQHDFLRRAIAFRNNYKVLTMSEFKSRKDYFIQTLQSSKFLADSQTSDAPSNPFADASTNDALMNMAKGNIMNFVPQTLIMAWVNFFFAGSVVMKLPFPLTDGFKSMLQSGVSTPDLNARYVSAISWYFVNLFGLRPIYSLLMDDPEAVKALTEQQQQQKALPNFGTPGAPKAHKVFNTEAESIQILSHESILDGIVLRILSKYNS